MTIPPRRIEIFSAGCPACSAAVDDIRRVLPETADIEILDMRQENVARRAADLGVRSVPAVAIDGSLASCCTGRGVHADAIARQLAT
jgi:glutaredoxin 3